MTTASGVREMILTRGLGIASTQGLQALSIGDLARDLELSRSGLHAQFRDVESLQLGVIEKAADLFIRDVMEAGSAAADGEARLRSLFAKWLQWSRSPRLAGGCPFVHASAEGDALPQAVRDRLDTFMQAFSSTLKGAVEAAIEAREFRSDIDAEQIVFELYGLYLSHHFWHWSMKDRSALSRTMQAFERVMAASR
ncbi:MAG: hypothetical protein NW216_04180 [Hyphomicrobium sp.]|nr:hypothetical protein [Hyphomicrobium sp.]